MKVAMLGLRGTPGTSGGAEVVAEEISTRLVQLGDEVTVYCRPHYTQGEPAEYKGVRLLYQKSINTKHFEAISHTAVCALNASFSDCDVVHFHSIGPSLMSWLPRLFGKRVVCTSHGIDWQRDKWGRAAKIMLQLGEWASARFPHMTTGVSLMIKEHYNERYNKDIVYIPNGVTLPPLVADTAMLERFGLQKDKYILFLSRIVPEKGLHYLIKAYKELHAAFDEYKLVIAGEPTHTEGYYELIRDLAKGNENIVFTGAVYGIEKLQLFQNAFCFVLPSDIEGMPIVLLESLANGCVPLVSDIAVNKSIVFNEHGRFGYSFKQGDVGALREVFADLLSINTNDLNALRSILRPYVNKHYDWQAIAWKYHESYLLNCPE